jgi:hypothetical protein
MYTVINFKSKKALKEAFKAGDKIEVYQPGGMFKGVAKGRTTIEGPHYPKPHSFYLDVMVEDNVITKIIS